MAALERYFNARGYRVGGYDRTPTDLTHALESEGISLTYDDSAEAIDEAFRDPAETLVVYTPAIPDSHPGLRWFRENGFEVVKRAAVLGVITRQSKALCFAGTHGKTTTSSMAAHLMHCSPAGCNAFLGGVLRNYNTNFLLDDKSPYSVVEADEYDRSFHHLRPYVAVITATDPDHLDIYGDAEHYTEAFEIFTSLIQPGGYLLRHAGLTLQPRCGESVTCYTYNGKADCRVPADWRGDNIRLQGDRLLFDLHGPDVELTDVELGTPIEINVDNAVAASAAALLAGVPESAVRQGLATFGGAKRRFEFHVRPGQGRAILIDDYAHSPNEIRASIASVRRLFPGHRLTVIFQPHLYTRTRDFASDLADALSGPDHVILPEIYPARELPIEGVDSGLILRQIKNAEKELCPRADLVDKLKNSNFDILMTLGAADLDRLLPEFTEILTQRY